MKRVAESSVREVAILVYDDVEVLDFAGPFEVLAVTGQLNGGRCFEVALVAAEMRPYTAVNGLTVLPNATLDECTDPDVLIIPGGSGSRQLMRDGPVLDWIRRTSATAEVVMSVCSGARVLARLGLLDGLEATTHRQVLEELAQLAPTACLRPDLRFVDTGRILTTGGISAGIDGALHLVARFAGPEVMERTARYMEYPLPEEYLG